MLEFLMNAIVFLYIAWNFVTLILYATDKYKAKNNGWRISEKHLLICAFAMGAIGAAVARFVFSHKTLKTKFNILIPAALFVNFFALFFLFERVGWPIDVLWLVIIFVAAGAMRDFRNISRNLLRR